jgi:hypothetical protein
MKLMQTIVEKNFTVKYGKKTYHISYVNSDGQTLALLNRFNWEVSDEDGESIMPLLFKTSSKKERMRFNKDSKLIDSLIEFCAKRFDEYKPEI